MEEILTKASYGTLVGHSVKAIIGQDKKSKQ